MTGKQEDLKMTKIKGRCVYCKNTNLKQQGERWQGNPDDPHSPWYTRFICLNCGERFILFEEN